MATYGAKYLQAGVFAETAADVSAEAFPKYGKVMNLGPLVQVTDSITYSEAKNYGDDELQEYANEFQELTVDAEMTEMPLASAAAIYGAALDESTQDLSYGSEDAAPYIGLAFYTKKQVKTNGVTSVCFQGVYYPKLKASRQGATYSTKGQSITFANGKAHFVGSAPANGKYQVFSKNFTSEEEAKAWVDAKIKAST